jgi:23S rRNA pseudouridine1911/1915/1917 synthase
MIAKNDKAHESLADQLKVHSVTREYTALVYDNIREDELTIDEPIGRDERNRMRHAVNGSGARNAVTHIKVLERFGKYTLVMARLETGRTHQIRVHMAYLHHPLVGDELYDSPETEFLNHAALHCRQITITHPITLEEMTFVAPLPEDIKKELEKSGFSVDKQ